MVYVRFPNFAFLIWVSRVVRLLWLLVSVGHRDACLSLCGPQTVFMSVFVPGLFSGCRVCFCLHVFGAWIVPCLLIELFVLFRACVCACVAKFLIVGMSVSLCVSLACSRSRWCL